MLLQVLNTNKARNDSFSTKVSMYAMHVNLDLFMVGSTILEP